MSSHKSILEKTGVPKETTAVKEEGIPQWLQRREPKKDTTLGSETSMKQVFERMAGTWTYFGTREDILRVRKMPELFLMKHATCK